MITYHIFEERILELHKMQENKIDDKQIQETFKFDNYIFVPDSEQRAIIESPIDESSIIFASIQRGMICTLCCRIKHLIDAGTSSDSILVITSNVAQARNLTATINRLIKIKLEIRTINSFCSKICKNEKFIGLGELALLGCKTMESPEGIEIAKQYKYVFFEDAQHLNETELKIIKIFMKAGSFVTMIMNDIGFYNKINLDNLDNFSNLSTYRLRSNIVVHPEWFGLPEWSIQQNIHPMG